MEKPILFNNEMVRAIMGGQKTVTRRIAKFNEYKEFGDIVEFHTSSEDGTLCKTRMSKTAFMQVYAPYKQGDTLYVRETWAKIPGASSKGGYAYKYKASDEGEYWSGVNGFKWKPSIHMPKEAARIWLKVTNVRVEQLQDMTREDAHAEGIDIHTDAITDGDTLTKHHDFSLERFVSLWDSTVNKDNLKRYGWDANPWVWVIEFKPQNDYRTYHR